MTEMHSKNVDKMAKINDKGIKKSKKANTTIAKYGFRNAQECPQTNMYVSCLH